MFPNNKLYEYQSTVRLKNKEPLSDERQDLVLSRVQFGHTHVTQEYLFKTEFAPQYIACDQFITVKHILIEWKYYEVQNLTILFSL